MVKKFVEEGNHYAVVRSDRRLKQSTNGATRSRRSRSRLQSHGVWIFSMYSNALLLFFNQKHSGESRVQVVTQKAFECNNCNKQTYTTSQLLKLVARTLEPSPMMPAIACGFLLVIAVVAHMVPSREPEPEDIDEENQMEPSAEPQSSRYESNARSLGLKFPGVFADAMFRAEGMLLWLYFRCQARVQRGKDVLVNAQRMNELADLIHMFMDRPNSVQRGHMNESLIALSDLTDDEESPRFQFSEQQVKDDIGEAFQGYQVGMGLFGHLRHDLRRPTLRTADDDEVEDTAENEEQRYHRYCRSTLSEVSDPDTWMEVRHEAEDERHYMLSERHEVSDGDGELWDEQQSEMMRENDEIARGEFADENEF